MPKIPLYQEQIGGVKTATGQLSPRASEAAFTAPSQAQASFFQKAGQIAFEFGRREKEAIYDEEYALESARLMDEADEYDRTNTAQGVEEYEAGFKDSILNPAFSRIGSKSRLTASQRRTMTNQLQAIATSKLLSGKGNAFSRQQERRGKSIDLSIEKLVEARRKVNPSTPMAEIFDNQINAFIAKAELQNIPIKYTADGVKRSIEESDLYATARNVKTEDDLVALENEIASKPISVDEKNRQISIIRTAGSAVITQSNAQEIEDARVSVLRMPFDAIKEKIKETKSRTDISNAQVISLVGIYENELSGRVDRVRSEASSLAANGLAIAQSDGQWNDYLSSAIQKFRSIGDYETANQLEVDAKIGIEVNQEFQSIKFDGNRTYAILQDYRETYEAKADAQSPDTAEYLKKFETLNKLVAKREEDINKDLADWMLRNADDPEALKDPMARFNLAKRMRLDLRRVNLVANNEIEALKEQLASADSAARKGQILNEFLGSFNQVGVTVDGQQVQLDRLAMRQLLNAGIDVTEMLYQTNPYHRMNENLEASILMPKDQLNNEFAATNLEETTLIDAVKDVLAPHRFSVEGHFTKDGLSAQAGSAAMSMMDRTEIAIQKLAKYLLAKGKTDNINDAAEMAASVILDNYEYPKIKKNPYRLPVAYLSNKETIQTVLEGYMTSFSWLEANIELDKFAENGVLFSEDAIYKDRFLRKIFNEGRVITSPDNSGIYIATAEGILASRLITFDELVNQGSSRSAELASAEGKIEQAQSIRRDQILTGADLANIKDTKGEEAYRSQLRLNEELSRKADRLEEEAAQIKRRKP